MYKDPMSQADMEYKRYKALNPVEEDDRRSADPVVCSPDETVHHAVHTGHWLDAAKGMVITTVRIVHFRKHPLQLLSARLSKRMQISLTVLPKETANPESWLSNDRKVRHGYIKILVVAVFGCTDHFMVLYGDKDTDTLVFPTVLSTDYTPVLTPVGVPPALTDACSQTVGLQYE
ncbi:UNVERIFIED_CONTAM: hypothetical protein ABIC26_001068 [Paenibacillus sp. PvR008]